MMGHSMGGLGSFRYGLLYPDRYCALAAHAASIN
ncbi:MAG: lysophospholipase [Bacteroidales bacterium]|nr:lysophospholipase [Bacteroidales bacterium]